MGVDYDVARLPVRLLGELAGPILLIESGYVRSCGHGAEALGRKLLSAAVSLQYGAEGLSVGRK